MDQAGPRRRVTNPAVDRLLNDSLGVSDGSDVMDADQPTGATVTERPSDVGPHDHAWRRVRVSRVDDALVLGEYRCDLCAEIWSL